jgi:hypothetical protein
VHCFYYIYDRMNKWFNKNHTRLQRARNNDFTERVAHTKTLCLSVCWNSKPL